MTVMKALAAAAAGAYVGAWVQNYRWLDFLQAELVCETEEYLAAPYDEE